MFRAQILRTVLVSFALFWGFNGFCQSWERLDSIEFISGADTIRNPFAGGLNLPQFSTIDLNNDLIEDLFVFDREDNKVLTFINEGVSGQIDYIHAPEYESSFPSLTDWALLRDYNCDGKPDIFTANLVTGVKVYRNTSVPGSISFVEEINLLQSDYGAGPENLFVIDYDIPAIADVDGDGDLDIITFDAPGSSVEFHQNQSAQLGDCDTLAFFMNTACWGGFEESSFDNTINLGVTCKAGATGLTIPEGLHSGSTLCTFDENGDGDMEILIGDLLSNELAYLRNAGDSLVADMDSVSFGFPQYDVPATFSLFLSSFYLDINNDGKGDLIASTNSKGGGINFENVWYYLDEGIAPNVSFGYRSTQFLQNEMIDLGSGAYPCVLDYNADGLPDLLVGNSELYSSGANFSGLALFENTGSLTDPSFDFITDDFQNLSSLFTPTRFGFFPTLGDLDGDNDQDLIIGDSDGKIHWMENSAGPGATVNFSIPHLDYMGIDIGNYATPYLIDLNRDSLPDLVIGEQRGNFNFFPNIGTSGSPIFSASPISDTLGGIDADPICCDGYSTPFFFENEISGKYEMMVGTEKGHVLHYANIDSNLAGNWTLIDSAFGDFYTGERSSIFGYDLTNNGQKEWLMGNIRGGLAVFGETPLMTTANDIQDLIDLTLFPNPGQETITLTVIEKDFGPYIFTIVDLSGKIVKTEQFDSNSISTNISGLSEGLYWIRITDKKSGKTGATSFLKAGN